MYDTYALHTTWKGAATSPPAAAAAAAARLRTERNTQHHWGVHTKAQIGEKKYLGLQYIGCVTPSKPVKPVFGEAVKTGAEKTVLLQFFLNNNASYPVFVSSKKPPGAHLQQ